MNKLDEHGDAYKDAQAPALWEVSHCPTHQIYTCYQAPALWGVSHCPTHQIYTCYQAPALWGVSHCPTDQIYTCYQAPALWGGGGKSLPNSSNLNVQALTLRIFYTCLRKSPFYTMLGPEKNLLVLHSMPIFKLFSVCPRTSALCT